MTDALDTDMLRAAADKTTVTAWEAREHSVAMRKLLYTAADELDRFMGMAAEFGRLHAVIAKAPHEPECQTWQPEDWPWSRDCTCWKASAL